MRFLVLPIFAALTVAGTAARNVGTTPPRPIVVFVHGRGQLGQDTAALRREWKRDLDSSLALVGMPRLRDEDVRLAWYADVLDPDSDSLCTIVAGDADSLGFGDFARGLLGFLASAVPKDESREMRGVISDLTYVVDPWKRCAAERRVGSVIEAAAGENRPVVVVAYSLGSLVAYGYLHSRPPSTKSSTRLRVITLGSPLGIPAIRQMVFGDNVNTLSLPGAVSGWENVYDPNDLFSGPVEGILVGGVVKDRALRASPIDEAHFVSRYLQDRVTGAAVMRALCEITPSNDTATACAR
jgi:pimeloyl-ACP methyl ester carboxylesterase